VSVNVSIYIDRNRVNYFFISPAFSRASATQIYGFVSDRITVRIAPSTSSTKRWAVTFLTQGTSYNEVIAMPSIILYQPLRFLLGVTIFGGYQYTVSQFGLQTIN
jgi:hypothetical protein